MSEAEVPKETQDALHAALAARKGGPPAPVQEQKAEEKPAEAKERPRGEDGKFLPKSEDAKAPELSPEARGLLAAVKAEREKRKALEAKIAALESRKEPVVHTDKREDLLKAAPPETKDFWLKTADPLVRETIAEEVRKILGDDAREALEAVRQSKAREAAVHQFQSDLQDFVTDMALEGKSVDPVTLVTTLERFEKEYDISLGSSNRKKFENAMGLLGNKPPRASEKGSEDDGKAKEAAEKARAGGVSPNQTVSVPPPNQRQDIQKAIREASWKGDTDTVANILAQKLRIRPPVKHPLDR